MFMFWRQAFNRPAFKGTYTYYSDVKQFYDAIEDTLLAVTTGILRARSGLEIRRLDTIIYIQSNEWNTKMEDIINSLNTIKRLVQEGHFNQSEMEDKLIGKKIDDERKKIIETLNRIFRSLDIHELPLPGQVRYNHVFPDGVMYLIPSKNRLKLNEEVKLTAIVTVESNRKEVKLPAKAKISFDTSKMDVIELVDHTGFEIFLGLPLTLSVIGKKIGSTELSAKAHIQNVQAEPEYYIQADILTFEVIG